MQKDKTKNTAGLRRKRAACLLLFASVRTTNSGEQARKVAKSRKKWEREMVCAYNADADDYKKLTALVKAKNWKRAFTFWQGLDTFVREGVPSAHMKWILEQLKN